MASISNCRISSFRFPLATVFICSMYPDEVISLQILDIIFGISEPDFIKQHYLNIIYGIL